MKTVRLFVTKNLDSLAHVLRQSVARQLQVAGYIGNSTIEEHKAVSLLRKFVGVHLPAKH